LLQRLAWPGLGHGLESKLELRRLGLGWRGPDWGWLRDWGGSNWSRPSLDWGGSGLGSDLLRLQGPGDRLDRNWSAHGLAGSDGSRHCGRLWLSQSEGIVIDRAGHRCRARSGLGLALAKRLENEESVGWLIGNRLGGGPGRGGGLGSGHGLTDNRLGHGLGSRPGSLGKVLGDVEGLEVELDCSSGDSLDCGGGRGDGPGLLSDRGGGGRGHGHRGQGGGGGLEGAGGLRGAGSALGSGRILNIEALASDILLEAGLESASVLVEGDGAGEGAGVGVGSGLVGSLKTECGPVQGESVKFSVKVK